MKLRGSLCAIVAVLLWANVSHACDSAHHVVSVDRIQQKSESDTAAQTAASLIAVEAELAADGDRTADYAVHAETWTRQGDIGAYVLVVEAELAADADRSADLAAASTGAFERQAAFAAYLLGVEVELAADAHRTAEFVGSAGMLLLDHEGESFAFVAASEMTASNHPSDENAVSEPADFLPMQADAPVGRLFIEVAIGATFSPFHGGRSEPEANSSVVTVGDESELARDGFEDQWKRNWLSGYSSEPWGCHPMLARACYGFLVTNFVAIVVFVTLSTLGAEPKPIEFTLSFGARPTASEAAITW